MLVLALMCSWLTRTIITLTWPNLSHRPSPGCFHLSLHLHLSRHHTSVIVSALVSALVSAGVTFKHGHLPAYLSSAR
jgi:hypothetical protein